MELVSNPQLLFLDEPTSGLDSQAAENVLITSRRVADTGVPVLCTIHQPSAQLFEFFDSIILLAKGGYLIYFGPREGVIEYFARNGQNTYDERTNPADFILSCSENVGQSSSQTSLDRDPSERHQLVNEQEDIHIDRGFDPIKAWKDSEENADLSDYLGQIQTHTKSDLTLNGEGILTVTAQEGHGIVSKDDLVFTSGDYTITSAKHGIS